MQANHPSETQQTINDWANETFGPVLLARAIARMEEEVHELRDAADDAALAQVLDECADVYITLCRVVSVLAGDLQAAVDVKMAVNRQRVWQRRADGTGYHCPGKHA